MRQRDQIEAIIAEHWVGETGDSRYPTSVKCMKPGCGWRGRFPGDIAGHNADFIMEEASDEV